jgi:hypothetical protein
MMVHDKRTGPLCAFCKTTRVTWNECVPKRHQGWRLFCSRSCAGKSNARSGFLARLNRQRSVSRYTESLKLVLGAAYKDGDAVTLAQLIRIARASYLRGQDTAIQRAYRRKVAA